MQPGIRRVRLRATRLADLMRARDLSPAGLQKLVGSPTFSTIYRWMRRGRLAPDAIVGANEEHVRRVAEALEVDFGELVDEPVMEDVASERALRLAAALGPVVYPELLSALGAPMDPQMLESGGTRFIVLGDHPQRDPRWRFERWLDCQRLLEDDTELPALAARRAQRWVSEHGVTKADEPALLHLIEAAAGEDAAWDAGLEWLRKADQKGPPAQAAWIGQRLLTSLDEQPLDLLVEVVLKTATALRRSGKSDRTRRVLSDALMRPRVLANPVAVGRLRIELARIYNVTGQIDSAIGEARLAETLLTASGANLSLSNAVQEHAFLLQRAGKIDDAAACLSRLESLLEADELPPAPRFYRLLGINALEHGQLCVARRRFEEAVRTAEAAGIVREAGLGTLNVALACALAGDDDAAEAWFKSAMLYAAGGDPGPLSVGLVHLNYGEYTLARGEPAAAVRLLEIGRDQIELSGSPPGLKGRCQILLAEACAALGQYDNARSYARAAHQGAIVADNPMYVAQALTAWALALGDEPGGALAWVEAALTELQSLPPDRHIVDRLGVERRCAEVRLRAGRTELAKQDLEALAVRARDHGIFAEARRIEGVLSQV